MAKKVTDATRLTAWRNFITAHANLIDLIDDELTAEGNLPLNWYDVLVELVEAPKNRLRLHELAKKVVLSRSGLTRLVDRLEKEGLLIREAALNDRRGSFAVLTEKGRDSIRKSWPVYSKGIAEHFAHYMNDEEAQVIQNVFARIVEASQKSNA